MNLFKDCQFNFVETQIKKVFKNASCIYHIFFALLQVMQPGIKIKYNLQWLQRVSKSNVKIFPVVKSILTEDLKCY